MKPQDLLLDVSARLCQLEDWATPTCRGDIKRLVGIGWKSMTASERRAFLARLDANNSLTPTKSMTQRESAELEVLTMLQGWQKVVANVTAADRGFALSIMKKRNNEGWWPSDAQLPKMRELWKERSLDGDGDVVE